MSQQKYLYAEEEQEMGLADSVKLYNA